MSEHTRSDLFFAFMWLSSSALIGTVLLALLCEDTLPAFISLSAAILADAAAWRILFSDPYDDE